MAKKSRKIKNGSEQHLPYGVGSVGNRVAPSDNLGAATPAENLGGRGKKRERYISPSAIERVLHRIRGGSDGISKPGGGGVSKS